MLHGGVEALAQGLVLVDLRLPGQLLLDVLYVSGGFYRNGGAGLTGDYMQAEVAGLEGDIAPSIDDLLLGYFIAADQVVEGW